MELEERMKLNPFKNRPDDDLDRQINMQQDQQSMDIAASTSPEEQMRMQQDLPQPELTKWQQNLDPWLKKMVFRLKRWVEVSDGDWKDSHLGPLCSDTCIYDMIALVEPNCSPNVINSKFTEDQISREMRALEQSVILDILLKERKKNKTALSHLSEVKKIFRSYAKPTYYRAFGGFEALNLRNIRTEKVLHSIGERPETSKKKAFFGF